MEDILNDINAVVGVTGCFICNGEGQVSASALPDLFDETILSAVGRTMVQTITGMATAHRRKIGDIDLVYGQGRLIAENLGEGCLCILCVRKINVPLLNLTANVAAKKLKAKIAKKEEPERTEAAPGELPEALRAMSDFIEQLMEELGDKGFGRDDLLKIVEYRLAKLRASYPFLQFIRIVEGKVDLSSLPPESLDAKEVGEALGALIRGISYSARRILGPEEAEAKYRRAYDPFYRQNKMVFESLGLGQTLEKVTTEEPPLPLGGVDLRLD
ncbi:MAG: roadblock/LC7 domain-containing protein [Anaerolineales bacterium]|nr:MAG: roadblock/LC7 domain-containing protein [Anaerolineales bacterium]